MATRDELVAYAIQAAQSRGIDAGIFVRQIDVESGFNPNALSPAGACGIAQIMPQFHPVDCWDPWASLDYAAGLDAHYLAQYGSWELALAAYNAGPGAVARYGGVPPYEETRRYIQLILGSAPSPPPNGGETGTSPIVDTTFAGGAVLVLVGATLWLIWG